MLSQIKKYQLRYYSGPLRALLLAALTLVPLCVVLMSFLDPQPEIWSHLAEFVLPGVLKNTLILMVGVGIGVLLLGVCLAWLTAVCDFPGRRFFSWGLMLPLAMPAYVLAFIQVGLLDFTGPLQTALRAWLGSSHWFPPIRSMGGVIMVLTLAFYPYVYLLARNAFITQGMRAIEAAQALGYSRMEAFWKLALPMARPWIAGGVTLALMETLADFGSVSIFSLDTFTTAIYKAWFSLFNLPAASQLASILVLFVLVLAVLDQRLRHNRRYVTKHFSPSRIQLRGAVRWAATIFCGLVLSVAFIIPLIQLIVWVKEAWQVDLDNRYFGFLWHSIFLSGMAALLVAILGLFLSAIRQNYPDWLTQSIVRLATIGYAIPGTVLAVGVFVPIAWLDNQLLDIMKIFGIEAVQILKGSLLVMLLALSARFLAVAFQPINASMQRITRNQNNAARALGLSSRQALFRFQLPMVRGGLLTAMLIVFVDVMKEMPITLMTRPFGWDTLAVRVFEMTSEGMWERAALPSLMIVLTGLLPVIFLVRKSENTLH
jgi:iron(III) transport system permease protein